MAEVDDEKWPDRLVMGGCPKTEAGVRRWDWKWKCRLDKESARARRDWSVRAAGRSQARRQGGKQRAGKHPADMADGTRHLESGAQVSAPPAQAPAGTGSDLLTRLL